MKHLLIVLAILTLILTALTPSPILACPAGDLACGAATTASGQYFPSSNAVDGSYADMWNSGDYPTQWIQIDLGSQQKVGSISLYVQQTPNGNTTHEIWTANNSGNFSKVYTFSGFTTNGQILQTTFSPSLNNVRYVKVITTSSPSWVAWQEIEVYGPPNPPPGPPPSSQPGDAGVGVSLSPIQAGSGQISQNGTAPGYRLENYSTQAPTNNINFPTFLNNILKNAGLGTAANLESQASCQPGSVVSTPKIDFYCYTNATFDSVFQTAATSGNTTKILAVYPRSDLGIGKQTVTAAKNISGRTVLVLVNGDLEVQANVTVTKNATSGLLVIQNNPTNPAGSGDLLVDAPVTALDGVYVFPGSFTDIQGSGVTTSQLLGNGSLLGIGTGTFTFGRTNNPGPGEQWTYEPKYLTMFNTAIALTKYTWQELPPQ